MYDNFGWSVSVSGDTLVVGAPGEDGGAGDPATDAGAAYVYRWEEPPSNLGILKTVDPATAYPGDLITYTLTFSNAGSLTATGVVITDSIPVSVMNTSVISSGVAITQTAFGYVWAVQDLAAGEGGIITITGMLSEPLAAGNFDNTATISTADTDSDSGNNQSNVSLTVLDAAPIASDDAYTTNEDTLLNVGAPGVLANDTDANGDPITAVLDDASQVNGALELHADGSFIYTPTLNANGVFTFSYHAHDGSADSNIAIVTLTVNAVNDAPVALDDAFALTEDAGATTLDVLGNDSDPEGDSLTIASVSAPTCGSVSISGTTELVYTPTNRTATYTDTFTYVASDGALTDTAPAAGTDGAIANENDNTTVQNSTFSGNSASAGGGIWIYGTLTLQNSTISGNSSGIYGYSGQLTLDNSIVAANTNKNFDGSLQLTSQGYNLSDNWNGLTIQPTDLTAGPLLGPLADNGGATWTHALLPASPAIDAGDPATCLAADQRGFPRTDLRCDMGAFEVQYADSDTVIKPFTNTVTHSFGPTWVSVTLSLTDTGVLTVTKHLACPGGTCDDGELPLTWHITSALSDGLPLTLSLCYTPELSGVMNEGSLRAFRWDTTEMTWTLPISTGLTVDEVNHCVTLTGIEQFSAWTLFDTSQGDALTAIGLLRGIAAGAWGYTPLLAGLLLAGAAVFATQRWRR